jgi:hypothetical protein
MGGPAAPPEHTVRGVVDDRALRQIEHLRRFHRVPEQLLVGALIQKGLDSPGDLVLPPAPSEPDDLTA